MNEIILDLYSKFLTGRRKIHACQFDDDMIILRWNDMRSVQEGCFGTKLERVEYTQFIHIDKTQGTLEVHDGNETVSNWDSY